MISNTEMEHIIDEVAEQLKKHFAPAFEIVKKDQQKVAMEFNRMASAINGTDEELKALARRVRDLEDRR